MIRDLEALLLTIIDAASREYTEEAVKCYNSGAYRAAVVLSVAAGMDGLRKQLMELANSGTPSPAITAAYIQIDTMYKAQQAYERQLLKACEVHASLLTPAEAKKLGLTLDLRNSCAHPSGHRGAPEEARDAIATVIDLVLSRNALLGNTGISNIMDRLSGASFFPDLTNFEQCKTIVEKEMNTLHPNILVGLAGRMSADLRNTANQVMAGTASPDIIQRRKNITMFLACMTQASQSVRQATWKSLGRVIEDEATNEDAFFIMSIDPEGLNLAEFLVRARAVSIVRTKISSKRARRAAKVLREKSVINADEIEDIVLSATAQLFATGVAYDQMMEQASDLSWQETDQAFFKYVIDACASSTFAVANPAIVFVQSLDEVDAQRIDAALQIQYVLNLASNAGRVYSASQAATLVANGLGDRSSFLNSLSSALNTSDNKLVEVSTDWKLVSQICITSGRTDMLVALCEIFDPNDVRSDQALAMFRFLKSCTEPSAVEKATEMLKSIEARMTKAHEELEDAFS